MKKTSTLLSGFLLLTIILHAQKKQTKFLTELSIGPSFPIGRFAEESYNDKNEVPGFAKTGLAAHLSIGYYLRENAGVLLSTGLSSHPQDQDAFRKQIESGLSGVTLTHLELKNWKTVKLMGGGFVVTPLTSEGELVLLTKLTAGVSQITIPKREFWGSNQDGTTTIRSVANDGSLPWSFCYQVSLSLQYKLNRSLYALLDINSFNTTAKREFTFTFDPNSPPSPGQTVVVKYKYKQATVNALLGIGVRF
jgi:hypothetical protein